MALFVRLMLQQHSRILRDVPAGEDCARLAARSEQSECFLAIDTSTL